MRVFDAGTEGDVESGKIPRAGRAARSPSAPPPCERRGRRTSSLPLEPAGSSPKRHAQARSATGYPGLDRDITKYREAGSRAKPPFPCSTNSYHCRASTILDPHEPGALYHLAQRRGYLSNRKSGKQDEDKGTVEPAINELRERMAAGGVRTLGEFLSRVDPVNERRIRHRCTARDMYLDEFEAIWEAQRPHHRGLLSDALKKQIADAIFHQRPLKSQKGLIGGCDLVPGKKRAPKALLISQRFRMLQKVNDLEVIYSDESHRHLTGEERARVLEDGTACQTDV